MQPIFKKAISVLIFYIIFISLFSSFIKQTKNDPISSEISSITTAVLNVDNESKSQIQTTAHKEKEISMLNTLGVNPTDESTTIKTVATIPTITNSFSIKPTAIPSTKRPTTATISQTSTLNTTIIPTTTIPFTISSTIITTIPTTIKPVTTFQPTTATVHEIDYSTIGVKFKQIVDETTDYIEPCVRLGNSVGLTQADFDTIPPYSKIKRCNIKVLSNGYNQITYEGESGFTLNGSNGNVFVEIPKHYIKRIISGGYEYRYISITPKDGYIVDPAFVENGKELNAVYVSAYEGYVKDGLLKSISNAYPAANYTRTQFRTFAKANGTGYGIMDIRTLNMLQNLFVIEFASLNIQTAIGGGWGKIYQPSVLRFRAVINENNANRIVIGDWNEDYESCMFVGSAIQCVKYSSPQTVLMTGHSITSIEHNSPQDGLTTFYFDGSPVNITTDFVLGGAAQKSGWADSLSSPTGKTQNHGTDSDGVYLNAVRYRYMENLWGNLWKWIDGINLLNGKAYYAENMSDYESGVTLQPYKPLTESQESQTSNGSVGGEYDIHYLKNLTFDSANPALALPKNYVNQGETSVPTNQTTPKLGNKILRNNHFGDYYYLNNAATCYAYGGGFDHYWRCGLFTLRGWYDNSSAWYLIGSRLIYKPN